jgi:hypothetical protein
MLDGIQSDDSDGLPEPEDLIGMLRSNGKVVMGKNDSSTQRSDERFQVLEDITERGINDMQGNKLSGAHLRIYWNAWISYDMLDCFLFSLGY